jgi:hypothetical protein
LNVAYLLYLIFLYRLRTDDGEKDKDNDMHEGQRLQIRAVIWKQFDEGIFMGRVTAYMEHEDW